MNKLLLSISAIFFFQGLFAQEPINQFKVELHGYVGVSAYYDTRQSVTPRNGNIYLFPKAPQLDANGNDINDHGQFDIDGAFSRFGIHISGPDVFGAKSFAMVEGDFLGQSVDKPKDLNFRLRHAFIRLNWEKSHLLVGQYWHPIFLTENFPSTININAGSPYHSLNRSPQIRFGYKVNSNIELLALLLSQNDFADAGLKDAMENSLVPEVDAQIKYSNDQGIFAAYTIGYKTLKPKLVENNVITDEQVNSFHMAGSLRKKFDKFTVKVEGLYGGNMTNLVMIGGVAKKTNGSTPTHTKYTALKTLALWTDIHSNNEKVQPGLFLGYSKSLGASENASVISDYSLGANIGNVYSISPRVTFFATPKIWLGFEWLWTVAAYGNSYDEKAKPIDLKSVDNHRILSSFRYNF